MEVYEIRPFGFCQGVNQAFLIARSAKKENPNLEVYVLGMIVHNEDAVESLASEGFKILDERKALLSKLLDDIPNGQVVVFSAHGHPQNLETIAKKKRLLIYDATCRYVTENLVSALKAVQEHAVIYIGVRGHLECEAFLSNCPKAILYDVGNDSFECGGITDAEPFVVSQTTLSYLEIEKAHHAILSRFPAAVFGPERCHSTTLRQKAMSDLPSGVDVVIVLGSERSNNSLKLAQIAMNQGCETHLVLDLSSLKKIDLTKKRKVAIASGASTSRETFEACVQYLRSL